MNLCVKQISGLEKVRTNGIESFKTIREQSLLGGESFSYQLAISTTERTDLKVSVSSPLSEHIKLYEVKNTIIDFAVYDGADDDYLTKEPGIMPDILIPIESENEIIRFVNDSGAIWVSVKIPENTPAGSYPITVSLTSSNAFEEITIKQTLTVNVIGANIPKQKTIFTQWFHVDCIADVHNVPIYSEEHWDLIDKYMSLASDLGINMILTPVITPPLDTEIGTTRPCTQLVKIEKQDEKYLFNFSLLKRWIELANKNNMKYFEISHLFSQWGLKYAPNIKVYENGKEDYMFGWHTDSQSEEYRNFLETDPPAFEEKGLPPKKPDHPPLPKQWTDHPGPETGQNFAERLYRLRSGVFPAWNGETATLRDCRLHNSRGQQRRLLWRRLRQNLHPYAGNPPDHR